MKKTRLIVLCLSTILFAGCDSDVDITTGNEIEEVSGINEDSFKNTQNSEDALLARFQAINDSISAVYSTETHDGQTKATAGNSIDWRKVGKADAKGAKEGFSYGWKTGRGFLGKISTAVITSAIYAVAYSAKSIKDQISSDRPGIEYQNPYSIKAVQNSIALAWSSQDLENRIKQVKREYPDFTVANTDKELKLALVHNVALDYLEEGVIVPSDIIDEFFSNSQRTYLNSYGVLNYYNTVPMLISGDASFSQFVSIDPFSATTKIMNTYFQGIDQISTSDVNLLHNGMRALATSYVKELKQTDSVVDKDDESNLITTIYLAPISLDHWRNNQ